VSQSTKKASTSAIWIVGVQSTLLLIAIGALSFGIPLAAAVLVLVAVFGVATALLVGKAGTLFDLKDAPTHADVLPILRRITSLEKGDLASKIIVTDGPLTDLATALNGATITLGSLARNGHETAAILATAGAEIERSTQAVAGGANRQVTAIVDVTRRVQALVLRCEEISQVVEVLDDLARQTNVLALNAALEASRAGPSGKGFAMVAEEVRKLAERSASATKDVGAFVQTLESGAVDAARTLDELQTLTKSLAEGAGGTAAVSNELMNAAKRLTETLNQLQFEGPADAAVRSLVAAKSVDVKDLIAVLRPLVSEESTPLSRAITTLIRTQATHRRLRAHEFSRRQDRAAPCERWHHCRTA
jgi:methyl-accepting chemotaxis protein